MKLLSLMLLGLMALWALSIAPTPAFGQQPTVHDSVSQLTGTAGVFRSVLTYTVPIAADTHKFEYLIQGSPSTVSIVMQGCMRGGSCTTLDTYTSTANGTRSVIGLYDYVSWTPTFTGGTNPYLTVNILSIVAGNNPNASDPCAWNPWQKYVINTAVNAQIAAGGAGKNFYVCKMVILPTAAAANANVVEGTGSICATATAGMLGGATAVLGADMLQGGGFVLPSDAHAWASTATAGDNICLFASAQVSGVLWYVGPL